MPTEELISVLLSLVVAGVVHLMLWRSRGERHLLLWGLSWFAFAARFSPMLWGDSFDARSTLALLGIARDFLLIAGASLYAGRQWWRGWLPFTLAETVLLLAGSTTHPEWGPIATGIRFAIMALALAATAVIVLGVPHPSAGARRLMAAGLLTIACAGPALLVLGAFAGQIVGALVQLGALAVTLGVAFSELDAAGRKRLQALAALEGTMQHAIRGHANVCVDCSRVEAADGVWHTPEAFIRSATTAPVTHGICPECTRRVFDEPTDTSWRP